MWIFLKKNWLNYLQTLETLIRYRILQCLHCLLVTHLGVSSLQWVIQVSGYGKYDMG